MTQQELLVDFITSLDGYLPVARQSNLLIETSDPKTDRELRKMLIRECKKEGKDYGYYFKQVTGGFTM